MQGSGQRPQPQAGAIVDRQDTAPMLRAVALHRLHRALSAGVEDAFLWALEEVYTTLSQLSMVFLRSAAVLAWDSQRAYCRLAGVTLWGCDAGVLYPSQGHAHSRYRAYQATSPASYC